MPEITQHCGDNASCRFYVDGICKRYPNWVERKPEDWCGEWQPTPGYPEQPEPSDGGDPEY